jgi:dolichol-phosphate mannosyltransferase
VVLPALNEREGVGLTVEEALSSLRGSRVLVVDGCSDDGTPEVAARFGATVLSQGGRGKGAAVRDGLRYLRETSPRPLYVVLCDADFSYPLLSSPLMIDLLAEDPSLGMVVGNRFAGYRLWDWFRDRFVFGNLVLRWLHGLLNGVRLGDPLSGLRVLRFEAVEGLEIDSVGFDLEVELNCRLRDGGWGIREVPVTYRRRVGGKKLRVSDGFVILRRMLRHRFGRRS